MRSKGCSPEVVTCLACARPGFKPLPPKKDSMEAGGWENIGQGHKILLTKRVSSRDLLYGMTIVNNNVFLKTAERVHF